VGGILTQPPIIVMDRDGCLYVFSSVADAEGKLEAPDVESAEYVAWDSEGTVLELTTEPIDMETRSRWARLRYQPPVRIRPTSVRDPEALTTVLVQALAFGDGQEFTLGDLVAHAVVRSQHVHLRARPPRDDRSA
jgi:hypothetical protein